MPREATLGPPGPSTQGATALSSTTLQCLPKRDLATFMDLYLKEQHTHSAYFASEGDNNAASHNVATTASGRPPPAVMSSEKHLLATPVLKARILGNESKATLATHRKHLIANAVGAQARTETEGKGHPRKTHHPKIWSNIRSAELKDAAVDCKADRKRRRSDSGSDISRNMRLRERRERKNKKKKIISENVLPDTKKKKKKPATKGLPNAQANMALMHGFNATNVGKSRITMNALLQNVGVFKKGRASERHTVDQNASKKSKEQKHFSEALFLKGTRVNRKEPSSISNQRHSKTPSETVAENISMVSESSVGADKERESAEEEKSILWDIERDLSSDGEMRESDVVAAVPLSYRPPQLISRCTKETLNGSPVRGVELHTEVSSHNHEAPTIDTGPSLVSLRPSQSASRAPSPLREVSRQAARAEPSTSKYFNPSTQGSEILEPPGLSCRDTPRFVEQPSGPSKNACQDALDFFDFVSECGLGSATPSLMLLAGKDCHSSEDVYLDEDIHDFCDAETSWANPAEFLEHLDDLSRVSSHHYRQSHRRSHFFDEGGQCLELAEYNAQMENLDDLTPRDMSLYSEELEVDRSSGVSFDLDDGGECTSVIGLDSEYVDGLEDGAQYEATMPSPTCSLSPDPSLCYSMRCDPSEWASNFPPDVEDRIRFVQGRALLFGINEWQMSVNPVPAIEAEVAGTLANNHWHPQRL